MLLVIAALVFTVLLLLFYIFLFAGRENTEEVSKEETQAKEIGTPDNEELAKPLHIRLFHPITKKASAAWARMTPKAIRAMFDEKIMAAGGFYRLGTDEFLALWGLIAIVITGGVGFIAFLTKAPANKVVGLSLLGLTISMLVPLLVLHYRISARRASIQKSLPEILDLLCVSVEAGLSFDGALAKVVESMKGPFAEECTRMLHEVRMGVTRRAALQRLSDRCAVPDVSLFTAALVQADQLGVSISKVLEIQTENVRDKRRQRIRAAAQKAPIKLLFPLVLFIFPALFIVLLGPAVISIMRNLVGR